MRRPAKLAFVLLAFLLIAIAVWVYFSPAGTAEFEESPDGRYVASASSMSRPTLFHGRVRYIELAVEDATKGKVCRVRYYGTADAPPPNFGYRHQRHITWADDSSEVTIPVGGGRFLTTPVP